MARFGFGGTKDATSVRTIINMNAAAANMRRFKLYDFQIGSNATPADLAFIYEVNRITTVGTLTAVVPMAIDQADTLASTVLCGNIITVEPTITAASKLFAVPMNQRASMRWAAVPGGELTVPATASAGLMIGLSAASTTTFGAGANFDEQ